jgi:hypothetical protein
MVALLWRRHQTGPALALESLWNELGSREQFSLFCSYPEPTPQQADAVRHVAELHSAVHAGTLPDALQAQPFAVAAFYDLDPRSPALARRMVRDVLTDRHLPHLAGDAMIVVSELVTNAVRHAHSGLAVTLTSTPVGVRITVTDSSGQLPVLHRAAQTDRAGRGLPVVDRLANRWPRRATHDPYRLMVVVPRDQTPGRSRHHAMRRICLPSPPRAAGRDPQPSWTRTGARGMRDFRCDPVGTRAPRGWPLRGFLPRLGDLPCIFGSVSLPSLWRVVSPVSSDVQPWSLQFRSRS